MSSNPSNLSVFQFQSHVVRSFLDDQGEPWFVAADVCAALELNNPTMALRRLEADEQSLITVEGQGFQQAATRNVVSEPGVYRLIFTSRKPEAEAFKRWLAHEVIPALRKTGTYTLHPTLADLHKQARQSRPLADNLQTRVAALIGVQRMIAAVPGVK